MEQTVVKKYVGNAATIQQRFAKDSADAAANGYDVVAQSLVPGKRGGCAGCLGVLLLGIPFLFYRPSDTLIVTYRLRT